MRKVEAIIRPESFQKLRRGLMGLGVQGLTVSEVAGFGMQKGGTGVFRGNLFEMQFLPKVKVELVLENSRVEEVIEVIRDSCATGKVGDGKIFVYQIDDAIRIRTGEQGPEAIVGS